MLQLFSFENVHSGTSEFVMVCETPPTASLPNCISARWVASWQKTQRISCHLLSRALVSVEVLNMATCVRVKSKEEGPGGKNPLQYFEFGLQYLV